MDPLPESIPGVTDDPVIRLLLSGEAKTLHEAEEKHLDSAAPEIYQLIGSGLSNEELGRHPLMQLLLSHSDPHRRHCRSVDGNACQPDIVVTHTCPILTAVSAPLAPLAPAPSAVEKPHRLPYNPPHEQRAGRRLRPRSRTLGR